jgi:prolyl oligopeptidase
MFWKTNRFGGALCLVTALAVPGAGLAQPPYPDTRKGDVVDTYFGTQVADPYRWLEDDNSAETKAWVKAQNELSSAYLSAIPGRAAIRDRVARLWNFEKYSVPYKLGKYYFYTYNTGLQNQPVLFVTEDRKAPGRVLIDPNAFSADGTVALADTRTTRDGRLVAYATSVAGSDWQTWKVRDVASGRDLPDEIRWSKVGLASWMRDGSGFYYGRFDPPQAGAALTQVNSHHMLYFHKLGTPQSEDVLVYSRPDHPEWYVRGTVTDDGRWLVITEYKGADPENSLYLKDLTQPDSPIEPFVPGMDAFYSFVNNVGDLFYVRTNKDAPRIRLVAIRRGQSDPATWKEVIPEARGTAVLDIVSMVGARFIATWARDARSAVEFYDLGGRRTGSLALPSLGTARGFWGRPESTETFYSFGSFAYPGTVYRLDLKTMRSEVFRAPKLAFRPADYAVKQVFYSSRDGTRVPMFIVHRKGVKLDGTNPTLLYAYGGFGYTQYPAFSPFRITWLEMGGVYALANIRGGSEYGRAWHEGARGAKRQNAYDDFIAAAEWLIANKYTSAPRLAINGVSNGGILVGAVLNQRPELFGAAVPEVGVMDMLRFHNFTAGRAWIGEQGSSETKEGFDVLYKYSPLHNIRPGVKYPPVLVMTADHDDRVVPAHSYKFTAAMQAAQAGPAPILARIGTDTGHGSGKPTAKIIEERADILAFLVKSLGMKVRNQ